MKIKYFPGSPRLVQIDGGDFIDLYTYKEITLKKGDFTYIPLGIAAILPEGYEAIIVPRSSTFKRYGLLQTNSIGVIDESYCGDDDQWMMPVYATRDITILKGTRLCQFRIQKHQPILNMIEVSALNEKNRGGFGSTGK
jgi:dUTP pyrophosphatase